MTKGKLYVSHINVRLSISILLFKLVVLEIISFVVILLLQTFLLINSNFGIFSEEFMNILLYILLDALKIGATVYIILEWLNEYYEITDKVIYHRRGFLFKSEEKIPLEQVALVEVNQSIFGRAFNFGTISLFDRRRNKYDDLYMIHNPMRYAQIIEGQLSNFIERRHILREHLVEKNEFDIY